jgi:molybdenum cofactor synthesis domain-containing protein
MSSEARGAGGESGGGGVRGRVRAPASAFVAPGAVLTGEVSLGERASVWYGAVLRADLAPIAVGDDSNIQDNAVVHVDEGYPATIGRGVVVGHGAVVHGAVVEDGCLIGMGAIVLTGAVVGAGSLVAAGALVGERKRIPPGSLVAGVPGKVLGPVTEEMRAGIAGGAARYVALSREYLARPAAGAGAGAAAHGPRAAARVAVLTVSDPRTAADDESGRLLAEGLAAAGHAVAARRIVPDGEAEVEAALRGLLGPAVDAVVMTGGTGVAPRDRAPEVAARVCERELPGFGELFRSLSFAEIGPAALASRAYAGQAGPHLVFVLPGSPAACRLGLERLLLPVLPHLVGLARGGAAPGPGE